MQELVKLVSQKTGLSEQMSQVAVNTVLNYLKGRLPAPLASEIDKVVNTGGSASGTGNIGGDIEKGLGGILGQK